jgi:hypothetical protein
MGQFWKVVLWIFIGFVIIGVLTHAKGFSLAAGTLFQGTSNVGRTLEGR